MHILSLGIPLAQSLDSGQRARVVARFDSTTQLEFDDGQWWAITTRDNPGAFRAVVDQLPTWAVIANNCHCEERSDEAISALLLGDCFAKSTRNDEHTLWNPRPRRRALRAEERARAASQLAHHLCELPDARGFWDALADNWEPIRDGLERRDTARLQTIFAPIIGRGPGLTPTGDDFLGGLLVTLRSGDARDEIAADALASAIAPVLANTTRASQQFLREAISGYAFGALKNLLDALPAMPRANVDALLRVGATSGAAYTLGVLMGLVYESV